MKDQELYAVWLSEKKHLSGVQKNELCRLFGGAEGLYRACAADVEQCLRTYRIFARSGQAARDDLADKDTGAAEQILQKLPAMGAFAICAEDEAFPAHLKEIPDCPVLLYGRGDVSLLKDPGIAVVGTRRSSPYGRWAASEIAARIAASGVSVISGMAEGIDATAQAACLRAKGSTIAVLGTGIDICFPSSNRSLFRNILDRGLAVSEYAPGTIGYASNFPMRNRIISGLSRAVIVVEGARKSGSMITAALAADQGRDVFAVPGNIDQPNSVGVNSLIADGAAPILDLDDLGRLLDIHTPKKEKRRSLSAEETAVLEQIRLNPGITAEAILAGRSGAAGPLMSLLAGLELKGLVRTDGGRLYAEH